MKKYLFLILLILISVNIYATMYTSNIEGPEDVYKNPAIISFSKKSVFFSLGYNIFEKLDLKAENDMYDIEIDNSREINYQFSGSFGFLIPGKNYSFGLYINDPGAPAFSYTRDNSKIVVESGLAKENEKSTKMSIKSKIVPILSKKLSKNMSIGAEIPISFEMDKEETEKNDITNARDFEYSETNYTVYYSLNIGLYKTLPDLKSEIGVIINSGQFSMTQDEAEVEELGGGKDSKKELNLFTYSDAPNITLGSFSVLNHYIGLGFESIISTPWKSKKTVLDIDTDSSSIKKNNIENEFSSMFGFASFISFFPESAFNIQIGYSIFRFYVLAHPEEKSSSYSDLEIYSNNLSIQTKYKTTNETYYYLTVDNNYTIQKSKPDEQMRLDLNAYSLKLSLSIGKSF